MVCFTKTFDSGYGDDSNTIEILCLCRVITNTIVSGTEN